MSAVATGGPDSHAATMSRPLSALAIAAFAATSALTVPAPAHAVTPTVVWHAPAVGGAGFSPDGSLAIAIGNTSAGGRLEIRRADTGAMVKAVMSPYRFNAAALSADNQVAVVTLNDTSSGLAVRTIRVYRVADGALLRAIPTAAQRELTSVTVSPDGRLAAAMDARSYERGGQVHVHRLADGATVRVLTAPATTATVRFSPDGRFLAANDRFMVAGRSVAGVRVFRTTDWVSVQTLSDNSLLLRWSTNTTAIWTTTIAYGTPTSLRLVGVPDGTVARAVVLSEYDSVADVSNDDSVVLIGRWAAPRRSLKLTSVSTAVTIAVYDFDADVFAGDISPDGALFSYSLTVAPSAFDGYAARLSG